MKHLSTFKLFERLDNSTLVTIDQLLERIGIPNENVIALNERLPMPPHVKLFLALHESRHCDQHREGGFMEGYYDTVVNGDREAFLQAYRDLERDANDFAISSMRSCGFEREMNFEEMRLRGNERAGDMVYQMMSGDIQRMNPVDFFDLLKKQIGV